MLIHSPSVNNEKVVNGMLLVEVDRGYGNIIIQLFLGLILSKKLNRIIIFIKGNKLLDSHFIIQKDELPHPFELEKIFPKLIFTTKPPSNEGPIPVNFDIFSAEVLQLFLKNSNPYIFLKFIFLNIPKISDELLKEIRSFFEPCIEIQRYLNSKYERPYTAIHIRLPQEADYFDVITPDIKFLGDYISYLKNPYESSEGTRNTSKL